MSGQITWGIIGCGNVTEVKSGPAFNKVNNSRLHAVMRRNEAKVRDYALRHQVRMWYTNADDLINDPAVNAVYIATPPKFHEEYAAAALQKGKFVYVEKPVTTDVASCLRLVEAVDKYKGKLVVAHYRRAVPMFQKIKQLVQEDMIGRIKLIRLNMFQPHDPLIVAATEVNWRVIPEFSGGGYFYDLAPHQLDIIQFIFGKPLRYAGISAHQADHYPAEDTVSGLALYDQDIVFQGNWNFSMPSNMKEDSCEIIGEQGSIKFPFFGTDVVITKEAAVEHLQFVHPQHIQQPMIQQVVDHFLGKSTNPCSIEEALLSMQVMEAFTHQK